jgi:hypothetical protein
MSETQEVYSVGLETLADSSASHSTACSGVTRSGDPCHAKAGPSGYCPLHNPARAAERERRRQAQEEAQRTAQAMDKPLRDMIKTRTTICKGKGWRVEQEHFDYQTGKHASLKAYRSFNFSEEVSVLIEITLNKDGTASVAFQHMLYHKYGLVLRSLNAITKEATIVAMILGRASPDPGLSPQVELSGGDAGGLLNLLGIGKALASQGIAAEESPPALLEIEPARSGGNEDLLDAWMPFQPGAGLQAVMTAEIVGDDGDIARGVVGFDVDEQSDVPFRIA